LKASANISFNPDTGLEIKTGFKTDNSEEIIPKNKLNKSIDGKYARIGKNFIPLPDIGENFQEWFDDEEIKSIPLDEIPEFIQRDLVIIMNEFNAVLTDLVKEINIVRDPIKPVVYIDNKSRGWLDFNILFFAGEILIPPDLLEKKNKEDYYIRINTTTWVKNDPYIQDKVEREIQKIGAEKSKDFYRLPIHEFVSLEEFIKDIGGNSKVSKAYQDLIDQLTNFTRNEDFQLPDNVEKYITKNGYNLRPYQRSGIHWLNWLRSNHLHGILADDMGLGKTLQALCVMRIAYDENRANQLSLIITPKSVLHHWDRELKRVFKNIRSCIYHGPNRKRSLLNTNQPIIFITTYETLRRDIEFFSRVPFLYLILDEATKIKNPDAKRTRAIKSLNAVYRLALSGTPIENRPSELWSLFDFLMRGHLGKFGTFARVYEEAILSGDKNKTYSLGKRISPFVLRRKKEQVAKDLPEKIFINESCELTNEQRLLYSGIIEKYKNIREDLINGLSVDYTSCILPILTYLKQVCDHPAIITKKNNPLLGRSEKFDLIIEHIDDIVKSGEKVVVFSHFLGMMDLIEKQIGKNNFSFIRIDGSTNKRQDLIDEFNEGNSNVAILSLRAASHGINLTSANHVIHADKWWNPAIEDQATDRVHRIGQERTVFVYKILVEGSLEERIENLINAKRNMADQIMGAATNNQQKWTKEDLIELLRQLD